mmetsp:Transcript_25268/g.71257  ORF Transcript_25268/g.71257 Transcript_25268/m.71257 type:complete len:262 (-) Transcript_25268:1239-2024(-)
MHNAHWSRWLFAAQMLAPLPLPYLPPLPVKHSRPRGSNGVIVVLVLHHEAWQALLRVANVRGQLVLGTPLRFGRILDEADDETEAVDDGPRDPAVEEAVTDVVGERHRDEKDEGRYGVARLLPVDLGHALEHHRAHGNERKPGAPRRDRGQDGREKQRDEEAQRDHDRRDPGAAALEDAGRGLDVRGHGGGAAEGADRRGDAVDEEGGVLALEVAVLVEQVRVRRHGVERARRVEEVDEEKHEDRERCVAHVGKGQLASDA